MNEKIEIITMPNYWEKSEFTVGIYDTKPTESISTEEYRNLAIEAIEIWNRTLHNFALNNSQYNHLENIKFTIAENVTGNEDIQIKWWFSNPQNGLTVFNPPTEKTISATIYVAKNQGPDIPIMPENEFFVGDSPSVRRSPEQIRSVVLHESGHVLCLGHCSYLKDLMKTGTPIQPDPNRRISNLDLKLISKSFSTNLQDRINNMNQTYTINELEWQAVQI